MTVGTSPEDSPRRRFTCRRRNTRSRCSRRSPSSPRLTGRGPSFPCLGRDFVRDHPRRRRYSYDGPVNYRKYYRDFFNEGNRSVRLARHCSRRSRSHRRLGSRRNTPSSRSHSYRIYYRRREQYHSPGRFRNEHYPGRLYTKHSPGRSIPARDRVIVAGTPRWYNPANLRLRGDYTRSRSRCVTPRLRATRSPSDRRHWTRSGTRS